MEKWLINKICMGNKQKQWWWFLLWIITWGIPPETIARKIVRNLEVTDYARELEKPLGKKS